MTKFMVDGGIFEDTAFEKVIEGTEETYGPFDALDEAKNVWTKATFTQKLDICTHRLKIVEIDER